MIDRPAGEQEGEVAYGRVALAMAAGFSLLEAVVYGVINESRVALAFCAVVTLVMLVLLVLSLSRPLLVALGGMGVYLLLQIGGMVLVPSDEFGEGQGLLLRAVILLSFACAIGAQLWSRRRART